MLVIVNVLVPVFVKTKARGADDVPIGTFPKLKVVGVRVAEDVAPAPVSGASVGDVGALEAIDTEADFAPAVVGQNF